MRAPLTVILRDHQKALRLSDAQLRLPNGTLGDCVPRFVEATLAAFSSHSLLAASQALLAGAIGSFGLVLTHSLDASSQAVIAARGQPMSFAVYPQIGAIVFGSEAQAVKAGLDLEASLPSLGGADAEGGDAPVRVDLDDLTGETILLTWHKPVGTPSSLHGVPAPTGPPHHPAPSPSHPTHPHSTPRLPPPSRPPPRLSRHSLHRCVAQAGPPPRFARGGA